MSEAVFFVVERTAIGEQAALYYDIMPRRLTGKNAARDGLVYAVRVDILPHAQTWLSMSLAELYEAYCKARNGKIPLPQNIIQAAPDAEPAKRKLGHREMFSKRQGSDLPAEPFTTVEELDRRAAKRRSIPRMGAEEDYM
jgi:hypothetical protein